MTISERIIAAQIRRDFFLEYCDMRSKYLMGKKVTTKTYQRKYIDPLTGKYETIEIFIDPTHALEW